MRRLKTNASQHQSVDYQSALHRITNRIRQSLDLPEILTTAAVEIRAFLKIDRIKIYRFHSDGSGEVIAESIREQCLPSLLGLHFPAADVPEHVRTMLVRSRGRVIVDVGARHKTLNLLHNDAPDGTQADLIRHSPLDTCHAEYLTLMGIRSSLTIPILHQNQLWGLLVSHHSRSRRFSQNELQTLQLLVDQLSIAIAQAALLQQAQQQAQHEATVNRISALLHSPREITEIRQIVLTEAVAALAAVGGRLYISTDSMGQVAQLYTCGEQPTLPWLEESPAWQRAIADLTGAPAKETRSEGAADVSSAPWLNATKQSDSAGVVPSPVVHLYSINDLYQAPQLQPIAVAFEQTQIRSILLVPLQYQQQHIGWLSVFRREIETATLWAGQQNHDQRNQRPRQSFAAWQEVKRGVAQEWTPEDLKLAQAVGTHLYLAIMQRRVEDMMRHQASHDRLTGLPNRLLFDDRLTLALAQAHQHGEMLAVMFLDLDRFKIINDTLGHAIGDQLLQQVAQRIAGRLKQGDTIARWGGDEFTLIIPHLQSAEAAAKIARRLLKALQTPFTFNGQDFHVTTSIGIALAPYDGEDAETLLKHADTAMYRAKQQSKNTFQFYAPDMNAQALEQLVLANDLYRALHRGEFLLHYQPQVDLQTGQVIAVEALLRWQHPDRGAVPPSQFIPLAEETGQIIAIGEWVIRTACLQNRIWQDMGLPPLRIAVNLSAQQFQQPTLVNQINQILTETKLAPAFLEIEITESIAMQNSPLTIAVLRELRSMGIAISIDDFGTGYSSLATLKHFPLDTLKVDREFIKDLTINPNDAAVVQAIIALGHGLGLKVIAEGVETVEQQTFLRSIQCDAMQGYSFSKPLPPLALAQLLRDVSSCQSPSLPCETSRTID